MEVQYDKNDPAGAEKEKIYLKCEVPGDYSYRVPSVDFDFIKTNFMKGPYKSGQTLLTLGQNAMLDLDKLEIILPDGEKPALSDMKEDEHHNIFGRKRKLATTVGTFSVLVVRIETNVSITLHTSFKFKKNEQS